MKRTFSALVSVELELPPEMEEPLRQLFAGEYEALYFGSGLTILDIGANVGAFSRWADLRWPGSTIHAYEPHPGTFEILRANVEGLSNVTCHRVAVYPSENATEPLFGKFAGDGQAGLVPVLERTWRELPSERIVAVPVIHPRELPPADIVKIDAEGSEAAILERLDLEATSLLLIEYHNLEVLDRIRAVTGSRFEVVRHESYPWREVLYVQEYRRELEHDRYGVLTLVNSRLERLRPGAPLVLPPEQPAPPPPPPPPAPPVEAAPPPVTPEDPPLRHALAQLPRLFRTAVRRRVARLRAQARRR